MKLTPRLSAVCDFVEHGSRIADIGTDHAYIPIYLSLNNIISYAVASDINEGPLSAARKNIEANGLNIRTCLAAGNAGIADMEADTLIIAGMGGDVISNILNERIPNGVEHIILQPMTHIEDARKALHANGYEIIREKFVLEDDGRKERLYTVINAKKGEGVLRSEFEYKISPLLAEDPLFGYFIKKEKEKTEKILQSMEKCENSGQKKYFEEYLAYINSICSKGENINGNK